MAKEVKKPTTPQVPALDGVTPLGIKPQTGKVFDRNGNAVTVSIPSREDAADSDIVQKLTVELPALRNEVQRLMIENGELRDALRALDGDEARIAANEDLIAGMIAAPIVEVRRGSFVDHARQFPESSLIEIERYADTPRRTMCIACTNDAEVRIEFIGTRTPHIDLCADHREELALALIALEEPKS